VRPSILSLSLFTTLIITSSQAWAKDLTLAQAINDARQQSPLIQKAKAAITESNWKKEAVFGAGYLPKLSANSSYYFGHKYEVLDVPFGDETVSFPSIYPTTIYGIKATLPLFDGFSNAARLEAATLGQNAAQKELSQAEFQLEEEVRLAFYRALTAQKIQSVTEYHAKALDEHFKQVQTQKRGGTATDYDVLRVQVQLSEAQLDAADARDNVSITRQKLLQLLGNVTDNRSVVGELPTPDIKLVKDLTFEPGLSARADIQSLHYRNAALQKNQASEVPWYMPKIAAVGSADLYNNKNDKVYGSSFRSAYQTGVIFNWDIYDGNVSKAKTEAMEAQRVQIETAIQDAKLAAYADFFQWKKKYISHANRFQIKQLDAQRSEESVRLARLEARAGTRTNTEVLDAELDLFQSRAGSVMAQMNAVESLIKLEIALGRTL
jgi:outer membrane protein TolC